MVGCRFQRGSLRGEVSVAWRGSQVGGKPGIYSDVEISTCAPKMKLSKYGEIHDRPLSFSGSSDSAVPSKEFAPLALALQRSKKQAHSTVAVALISTHYNDIV